ncbi:MAG: hypothetical protein UZ14_CFX002001474 [Chloroflexi bacterium OLB14]|nr:MAG: hypothetical protein UZ14_CFX002001474 [Chloroflexi bacterium OLB14]
MTSIQRFYINVIDYVYGMCARYIDTFSHWQVCVLTISILSAQVAVLGDLFN